MTRQSAKVHTAQRLIPLHPHHNDIQNNGTKNTDIQNNNSQNNDTNNNGTQNNDTKK